jgi:polyphosphate kinase 2 (PPK2 family)
MHPYAPWFVIRANRKENARLIVSQVVIVALNERKMASRKTSAKRGRELQSSRKLLATSRRKFGIVGDCEQIKV